MKETIESQLDKLLVKRTALELREILKLYHGEKFDSLSDKEIFDLLDIKEVEYDEKLISFIDRDMEKETPLSPFDLLTVYDPEKEILSANGCIFDKTSPEKEISGRILLGLKKIRDSVKALMFKYEEGSFFYNKYDSGQKVAKVNMNAAWGAMLESSFFLNDVRLGGAITNNGYMTSSTMVLVMESFWGNLSLDEHSLYDYLKQLKVNLDRVKSLEDCSEKFNFLKLDTPKQSLQERILKCLNFKPSEDDIKTLSTFVQGLSDFEATICYYTNNVVELFNADYLKETVFEKCKDKDFLDPNKPPKTIKPQLDSIYEVVSFLCFPSFRYNASEFARRMERENILVTDTDSFFVYYRDIVFNLLEKFGIEKIIDSEDKEEITLLLNYLNCYIYMTGLLIKEALLDFTIRNGIREEDRATLNMKNEFVFLSLILTNGKKNYVGERVQREGHLVFPPKLVVTGIPFKKRNVPYKVTKKMMDFAKKFLKYNKFKKSMSEFVAYESEMRNEIYGNTNYFSLKNLKSEKTYADPLTQEVFRGSVLWNTLYPESSIQDNEDCLVAKLKTSEIERILKERDPNSKIFQAYIDIENRFPGYSTKNPAIATPLKIIDLPSELKDLIDIESIVSLNLSTFTPILKSFGLKTATKTNAIVKL